MKAGISDYTSGLRALVLMLYLRAGYGPAEEAGWCQVPAHVGGDEMGQGELQDLGFSHFLLHPLPHWVLVTFFFFLRKMVLFKKFINLWLHRASIAACELSLIAASGGYCPVALQRLLTSEACVVAEHGLSSARGFSSCGVWTQHAARGL